MPVFFISDIHLGEQFPEREKLKKRKLESFLDMVAEKGTGLFVAGDLFDFWFEYKHAIPKGHLSLILRLADLHRKGIELTYITGNHDFWLGDFLSREVGFKIYRDKADFVFDGKRLHVIHGDGIARVDYKYRILKKILQNPFNIFLYRMVPPDIGIPLAKFVSGKSRGHTQKRPKESFLDEYRQYAFNKLDNGYDMVIMAHTHVPEEIRHGTGVYINTGDWVENFTYAEYGGGILSLKRWE